MQLRTVVPCLVVVLLAAAAPASRAAADKEIRNLEQRREDRRQEFILDQRPPEQLQRMATTPCDGGFAGSYPCKNVDLLAFLPLSAIGGGNGNDIWGWTDPLTGKEYAIMGRTSGTSFVDISDPANPVYLGNLPPNGSNSSWRDIKVYSDHAYIVSEAFNHGMQVFDLTRLRDVVAPPVTFTADSVYTAFGSAHNLAIDEDTGYGYAVGTGTCSGGPHFIDLSDPAAPAYAGCHIEPIYTHDTQCVVYHGPDAAYQGREICFNSNENKVNIVDVTDKADPQVLSQTTYPGVGYTHQGWLTEDHAYFLLGDELDEQNFGHNTRTRIFDVRDLRSPSVIGIHDGPTPSIDHNLYTLNGYVYEANYRSGLRILDLSDVAAGNLTEVAFFDIYPSSDSANFNGAWSVYPYYDSGVIVVSGIEQGLFVLQPVLAPDFRLDLDRTRVEICEPGQDGVTVDVGARNGYTGDVTLDLLDAPTGAAGVFVTNPVSAPGSSQLDLSTSGAAPGSYQLSVAGDDGALTHDTTLTLEIADDVPVPTPLVSPADGAVGVSRTPTLAWLATVQGFGYELQVAGDPAFAGIVHDVTTTATSAGIMTELAPTTTYWWRVRGMNACGAGEWSAVASFTTLDIPPILVVDDDDNGPDVRAAYVDTLNDLGLAFDVWDTGNSDSEPSAAYLAPYSTVIWFTGDEFGGTAGPGAGGESALASWLDTSRCLLIASQDYYYDRGLTAFFQTQLGVASATSDVGQTSAEGRGTTFGGLGPYTLSFPYSNYTDTVDPAVGTETAFAGSAGNSAVDHDAGVYRTSFWSFGLETLPTPADRMDAMGRFLDWCTALADVDADGDGQANGVDCAPGDVDTWAVPTPATGLALDAAPGGAMQWQAPAAPGATSVVYDVLRSTSADGFDGAACVVSGAAAESAADAQEPLPGELLCYLVRARNACGGTLGDASGDTPRVAPECQ